MPNRLPQAALALGLAGLLPFIGCGIAASAWGPPDDARAMLALLGYGAVVLAFLGGVHWGFALAVPNEQHANGRHWRHLSLAVVPSLIGWGVLLVELVLPAEVGLGVLIAGYVGTVALETAGYRRGFVPTGYMWLRWGLSAVVLTVLITVLGLRLVGAKIIF